MEKSIESALKLLQEIYIGSAESSSYSFVTNGEAKDALLPFARSISSRIASTPTHEEGTTIASHIGHLRWSLKYVMAYYEGRKPEGSWSESWVIRQVDDDAWNALREDLEKSYLNIVQVVQANQRWDNQQLLDGTIALPAHAAYHLGAVKQIFLGAGGTGK